MPLVPGPHLIENYTEALGTGLVSVGTAPVGVMMLNSLIMALGISIGKILISIISAFAFVYFRFPLRKTFFALIFAAISFALGSDIRGAWRGVIAGAALVTSSCVLVPYGRNPMFPASEFVIAIPGAILSWWCVVVSVVALIVFLPRVRRAED